MKCKWCTVNGKLDAILSLLRQLMQKEDVMSAELDALTNQVRANTNAEQSAVTLLGQLSTLIKAAGTDPAKLAQLTSDLDTSKQALAAAIVANTPAAATSPAPTATTTPSQPSPAPPKP